MKKLLPIISAAFLLFAFSGCSSGGAGGTSEAEEAAEAFSSAMGPLANGGINFKSLAMGSELDPELSGVSISTIGDAIVIDFDDFFSEGYTYNGSITLTVSGDFDYDEESEAFTGSMVMGTSGTLSIEGPVDYEIAFNYEFSLNFDTELAAFSGTITLDGKTYQYADLAPYLEE